MCVGWGGEERQASSERHMQPPQYIRVLIKEMKKYRLLPYFALLFCYLKNLFYPIWRSHFRKHQNLVVLSLKQYPWTVRSTVRKQRHVHIFNKIRTPEPKTQKHTLLLLLAVQQALTHQGSIPGTPADKEMFQSAVLPPKLIMQYKCYFHFSVKTGSCEFLPISGIQRLQALARGLCWSQKTLWRWTFSGGQGS